MLGPTNRNNSLTFGGAPVPDTWKFGYFLDFLILQGNVGTYCRWDGNLLCMYVDNFPTNHLVIEFWKSVHICQSYCQTSRGILFWDIVYLGSLYFVWARKTYTCLVVTILVLFVRTKMLSAILYNFNEWMNAIEANVAFTFSRGGECPACLCRPTGVYACIAIKHYSRPTYNQVTKLIYGGVSPVKCTVKVNGNLTLVWASVL